ncbi:putative late blight resistance protein homolog R1B-12 [Rhododendron vialii]|uniref:putative late blight resistance protein homolog R1B-12 n=1 Tax=Rhododendron vialii TaxID=182163 RepID=UPI00265E031E|nr:putative late blight resistance protein homolog R1B-12 [Rhododendron vialii]
MSFPPLSLRFLSPDESWNLSRQKIFQRETCPSELMEIGKQIAQKWQGLPLAIAVVAGILRNEEKSRERWKQVGQTLNSQMAKDQELWTKTIALSYNHLPPHLKPCFLYFAIFPEDLQILVRKLIWLWVAEGFIRKTGTKSLEDVAEEYLMDLIGRKLVFVSRRGLISSADKKKYSTRSIFPFHYRGDWEQFCCEPNYRSPPFKLLRVVHISYSPPCKIELVLLKYLDLCLPCMLDDSSHPTLSQLTSLSNLVNLETLIFSFHFTLQVDEEYHFSDCVIYLPHSIRKLVKLRHELKVSSMYASELNLGRAKFPPNLTKLTLKGTRLSSGVMSTLAKLVPNLEALKLSRASLEGPCWEASGVFPKLKSLKFQSHYIQQWDVASSDDFPSLERLVFEQCPNLKKIPSEIGDILTLEMIELDWCNPSLDASAREIKKEQESQKETMACKLR